MDYYDFVEEIKKIDPDLNFVTYYNEYNQNSFLSHLMELIYRDKTNKSSRMLCLPSNTINLNIVKVDEGIDSTIKNPIEVYKNLSYVTVNTIVGDFKNVFNDNNCSKLSDVHSLITTSKNNIVLAVVTNYGSVLFFKAPIFKIFSDQNKAIELIMNEYNNILKHYSIQNGGVGYSLTKNYINCLEYGLYNIANQLKHSRGLDDDNIKEILQNVLDGVKQNFLELHYFAGIHDIHNSIISCNIKTITSDMSDCKLNRDLEILKSYFLSANFKKLINIFENKLRNMKEIYTNNVINMIDNLDRLLKNYGFEKIDDNYVLSVNINPERCLYKHREWIIPEKKRKFQITDIRINLSKLIKEKRIYANCNKHPNVNSGYHNSICMGLDLTTQLDMLIRDVGSGVSYDCTENFNRFFDNLIYTLEVPNFDSSYFSMDFTSLEEVEKICIDHEETMVNDVSIRRF